MSTMPPPAPPPKQDQVYTVKDHPENLTHVYDRKKRAKGQRLALERAMER